jgi:transposase
MLAVNEHVAAALHLSGGGCHDAPQGRKLLEAQGSVDTNISLLMDRAYESDITRDCALNLGYSLCVPPKSNRKEPWGYDRELYKRRNEVERLFRRIKAYRRIFTRYDKLDVVFLAFVFFALIVEALR